MSVLWVQLSMLAMAAPLPEAPHGSSVHGAHQLQFGAEDPGQSFPVPALLPDATRGPDAIVYGYQAYWDDDLNAVPWDELSHIALFAAEVDTNGNLSGTSRWDEAETAVQLAQPYGVKVHLCVINFSTSELGTLLGSSAARANLIDNLRSWVDATGTHGVNIDFEGMPSSRRDELVTFAQELNAEFGDEVVFASPAVDWSGAWDYSELTKYADLFIMGYAYHYSGSSTAGPNDPLFGGSPWGVHSLAWTVEDYLDHDAVPSRVILGLPLYGIRWPVGSNTVPASATGSGSAVFYAEALAAAATHGEQWEPVSETPYWYDGSRQGWYSNEESLRLRIQHARDAGLGGIGFWALHYDDADPALWSMVREETTDEIDDGPSGEDPDPEAEPSGGFRADAGRPFLAYVGDTVILSAQGSEGPADVELDYAWTQVGGPAILLDDPSSPTPSFQVEAPGTHTFELVVGSGDEWSTADTSFVVVLDPGAGTRHAACGCNGLGGLGWTAALLPLLAMRRRRGAPTA